MDSGDAPSSATGQADGNPGSPDQGEPGFLAVGRLRRPHGLTGEVLMEVLTDFPERLVKGSTVYVGPGRQPFLIRSMRWHGKNLLLAFEGIEDRDTAGELRNQWAAVRADDRPALPEGDYYHHQLIGMRVVDEVGDDLGTLEEILQTGANDVLIVRSPARGEILLPMIDSVVLEVDVARGLMRIHLLPGLE